jgi:hypothetical protein
MRYWRTIIQEKFCKVNDHGYPLKTQKLIMEKLKKHQSPLGKHKNISPNGKTQKHKSPMGKHKNINL